MKTAEDSKAYIRKPALEDNVNDLGHVTAGHLAKLIDLTGVEPPFLHVDGANTFVTAALDRTNFVNPIHVWDIIEMEGRITRVWNTSLETEVSVHAVDMRQGSPSRRKIATARLVYVGLGSDRKPVKLPPLKKMSLEDYRLAKKADLRKENRHKENEKAPYQPMDATDAPFWVENMRVMTDKETNSQGNIFGGILLEELERAARHAAKKQVLGAVVTGVRMDRMNFLAPAFVGETLQTRALVTRTWKTSLELLVEIEAINPNKPGKPRKIANSYMVFVRLRDDGVPAEVPSWEPETVNQKVRAAAADVRRVIREEEKAAGKKIGKISLTSYELFVLRLRNFGERLRKSAVILFAPGF